jgi:hypothetical protein
VTSGFFNWSADAATVIRLRSPTLARRRLAIIQQFDRLLAAQVGAREEILPPPSGCCDAARVHADAAELTSSRQLCEHYVPTGVPSPLPFGLLWFRRAAATAAGQP